MWERVARERERERDTCTQEILGAERNACSAPARERERVIMWERVVRERDTCTKEILGAAVACPAVKRSKNENKSKNKTKQKEKQNKIKQNKKKNRNIRKTKAKAKVKASTHTSSTHQGAGYPSLRTRPPASYQCERNACSAPARESNNMGESSERERERERERDTCACPCAYMSFDTRQHAKTNTHSKQTPRKPPRWTG